MFNTTLIHLKCPKKKSKSQAVTQPGRGSRSDRCGSFFHLSSQNPKINGPVKASGAPVDVRFGELICQKCASRFPILEGIAVLVPEVRRYLQNHVKGIAQIVKEHDIPQDYRRDFRLALRAQEELGREHIEEDLEAERVNALYLMNHYLKVKSTGQADQSWWRSMSGESSPLINNLVRDYWDQGPFAQIEKWLVEVRLLWPKHKPDVVELGCGVGGLVRQLKASIGSYLGVDSSFASVALARHLALGSPYPKRLRIPADLLQGPASRELRIAQEQAVSGTVDFIVGELENCPLESGQWDVSVSLNTIDMLDEPSLLPELQSRLLKPQGLAFQSCPYIWHEAVSRKLRKRLPRHIQDSAQAVEWLYGQVGFEIQKRVPHLPWLFFKQVRQLEIYSVHLFQAIKKDPIEPLAD